MTAPHLLGWDEEPAAGSVVAIGYGTGRPEVWVACTSNIGNWYPAYPPGSWSGRHPVWGDVVEWARHRQLDIVLLVPADGDAWNAGRREGIRCATRAVEELE